MFKHKTKRESRQPCSFLDGADSEVNIMSVPQRRLHIWFIYLGSKTSGMRSGSNLINLKQVEQFQGLQFLETPVSETTQQLTSMDLLGICQLK